ncbi:hypothetical protein HCA78_11765 [Listeria booriae]|uniref:Uncharacterized protein n=1 Tax=Listeria booriae TaxID=1552123 RepID=A0A842CUF7_9LIST|nr:hypothetical protein [Listeria booriae]MBC2004449.1 hypothetical protein [Listeria booriae]
MDMVYAYYAFVELHQSPSSILDLIQMEPRQKGLFYGMIEYKLEQNAKAMKEANRK